MKLLLLLTLILTTNALPGQEIFAANVYKELIKENSDNFAICPLTVQLGLGFLLQGARGETAKQLIKGLNIPEEDTMVKKTLQTVLPSLKQLSNVNVSTALKLYLGEQYEILEEFKYIADEFEAGVENIDFGKSQQAADKINQWVEENTNGNIKDLVDELTVRNSFSVLVSTMYLQANWEQPFPTESTADRFFYLDAGHKVGIPMMSQTGWFKYYESSELNAKILEMPYEGDTASMIIVLSNDINGFSSLERNIDKVLRIDHPLKEETVDVTIPLFTIQTKVEFKPILQALGIVDAFNTSADFTGISRQKLEIDKVLQKTFINVNEIGTTAASATEVDMKTTSGSTKPKEFYADRSFIYYITSELNPVMFFGRYIKPENV